MSTPLVSAKSCQELREAFVRFYSVRTIEEEFTLAGIASVSGFTLPSTGQRRAVFDAHCSTLDLKKPADARKLFAVFASVLGNLETIEDNEFSRDDAKKYRKLILKSIERDGLTYSGGRIAPAAGSVLQNHQTSLAAFDLPELHRQIERMNAALDSDPALAVGTAKELVETTCKTILDDKGVSADPDWDVPRLVKETRKVLSLLPSDIPDQAKGVDAIRRLLSSLGTVGQGVAEVRNLYGTGHGKHGKTPKIPARIARLAVGSAATLATFLLETHSERNNKV